MEIINEIDKKVVIEYPCTWCYKVITKHEDHTKEAIADVISEREHTLKLSNSSKGGKYVSMNLELLIQNEDERNFIFQALKEHQKVMMVL